MLRTMKRVKMKTKDKIHRGSRNVFSDLALPNPEKSLVRAQIMARVAKIIEKRGLTQKQAAVLLHIPQSKVSCLVNGKLSLFTIDKLFEFLNALDTSIEITIRPKTRAEKTATNHIRLAA